MQLKEILQNKGREVQTIAASASCDDVVSTLVRFNIGSLLVHESPGGPIVGVVTERDILRALAERRSTLDQLRVAAVMTTNLIVAQAENDILEAMRLMTTHRIRHLPVMDGQQLFGIVSIGDIVKAQHDRLEMENHQMLSYIQGGASAAAMPLVSGGAEI